MFLLQLELQAEAESMETRIRCRHNKFGMDGQDGFAAQVEGPSYLRLTCKVTVRYAVRRLGGGGVAEAVHTEPARTSESKHLVDDPAATFLDYDRTKEIACRLFSHPAAGAEQPRPLTQQLALLHAQRHPSPATSCGLLA